MIFTPKVCGKQTFGGKKQTFKGKSQRHKWRQYAKNLTSYRLYRLLGDFGALSTKKKNVSPKKRYELELLPKL